MQKNKKILIIIICVVTIILLGCLIIYFISFNNKDIKRLDPNDNQKINENLQNQENNNNDNISNDIEDTTDSNTDDTTTDVKEEVVKEDNKDTSNNNSKNNTTNKNNTNNSQTEDKVSNDTQQPSSNEVKQKHTCNSNDSGYVNWLNNLSKTYDTLRFYDSYYSAYNDGNRIAKKYLYGFFVTPTPTEYSDDTCEAKVYSIRLYVPKKLCEDNDMIYLPNNISFENDNGISAIQYLKNLGYACTGKN